MLTLPDAIVALLLPFATLFTSPTWRKAQLLLVGAILTPGQRTVAAALRVMGRSDQATARYHLLIGRPARQRAACCCSSTWMVATAHISAARPWNGVAAPRSRRGPSTGTQCVPAGLRWKASGLRWISLMWLGHVSWAGRHWALPVLTVLAPSTRYYQQQGRQHKKLTDWARQMVMQLRRWLPHRPLVLVGDNSYAVLDLLHCCQSLREPVTLIARLRLDAALYAPAPPRQPGQNGRPPLKGPRRPPLKVLLEQTDVTWASAEVAWYDGITRAVELTSQTAVWYRSGKPPVLIRWVLIRDPQGSFATQALLCTDPAADPTQILEWFVLRWQLEVTFHEVRTHLGVETQRQWSDLAIARTTPALLGLFSWTTLAAHALQKRRPMAQGRLVRQTVADLRGCHWRVATCGWRRKVSHCRSLTPTFRNSRSLWTCRFPCLRRLNCVKPSLEVVNFIGPGEGVDND